MEQREEPYTQSKKSILDNLTTFWVSTFGRLSSDQSLALQKTLDGSELSEKAQNVSHNRHATVIDNADYDGEVVLYIHSSNEGRNGEILHPAFSIFAESESSKHEGLVIVSNGGKSRYYAFSGLDPKVKYRIRIYDSRLVEGQQ